MDSSNSNDSLKSILARLTYRFNVLSETASLDAQVLAAHVLGVTRTWLLAHPESCPTAVQAAALESAARRVEGGEPLPYVLGNWEFYGRQFEVSPQALIPRPETELLVDTALTWLRRNPGKRLAADVGTGTGCIAVSLAAGCPDVRLIAADIWLPALRLASRNAARHFVADRVACVQADLLPASGRRFDLICANLPYIPSETLAGLPVRRWEPVLALDGGPDGLDLIRRLLAQSQDRLAPGGCLLLEIEARQGEAGQALAQEYFPGEQVSVVRDLAGRDRLITVDRSPVPPRNT